MASRLIERVFETVGQTGPLQLRVLFGIAERLYPELWAGNDNDRIAALQKTVLSGIHKLPDVDLRKMEVKQRVAARLLYGFEPIDPDLERELQNNGNLKLYGVRVAAVLRKAGAGVGKNSMDRATRLLRKDLATALLSLDHPVWTDDARKIEDMVPRQLQSGQKRSGSYAVGNYVSRPELQDEFKRAVEVGAHVVCLTGDRGFGKSTLARALARDLEAEERDVLWLRASDEALLYRDLAERLAERHIQTTGATPADLQRALGAFLGSNAIARPVVVLDNVQMWDVAKAIITTPSTTLYLLTSNRGALLPAGVGESIDVDAMTEPQAIEMAYTLLGDQVTADERVRLVARLNCRPIAIEHACGYLRRTKQSVDGLFKQLDADAARFFGRQSEGIEPDQLLGLIYRGMLADLEDTSPEAARLLKLVGCVAPDRIPCSLLSGAFGELAISGHGPDLSKSDGGEFFLALDELMRLRVVKADDRFLSIHSLTQDILRGIVSDDDSIELAAIQQTFHRSAMDIAPFGLVPEHILDQAHHVDNALRKLFASASEETRHALRLGHSAVLLCRAYEHIGDMNCRANLLSSIDKAIPPDDPGRCRDSLDDLELMEKAARVGYDDQTWNPLRRTAIESRLQHCIALNEIGRMAEGLAAQHHLYRYPWWQMLRLDAALQTYSHETVVRLLRPIESELLAQHDRDRAWRAELLLRLGRAQTGLAMWSEAAQTYESAQQLFAGDEIHAVYGQITTLSDLTWCRLLEGGDAIAPATQLNELYKATGQRLSFELAARVGHAVGAAYTNLAIRQAADGRPVEDRLRANGLQALRDAHNWYGTAHRRLDQVRVQFDLLCFEAALPWSDGGTQAVLGKVEALSDEVRALGDPELVVRFQLLAAKVQCLLGSTYPFGLLEELKRVAYKAAFEAESPYWHSEAILTAGQVAMYAEDQQAEMPASLEAAIQEAFNLYRSHPDSVQALVYRGRADKVGILSY